MNLLLRSALVFVVLIAGVLLFAMTKPCAIRIQRSITINASPGKVFALINDFHNWTYWAPQDKGDSSMSRTYSGPKDGVGAVSDWRSKGSAGQGRMSITESMMPSRVAVKVDFVKPFEAHNLNEFVLAPAGSSTSVTWTMEGTNVYMMKVMSVFISMDRMMGNHFETGLENLKAAAEK